MNRNRIIKGGLYQDTFFPTKFYVCINNKENIFIRNEDDMALVINGGLSNRYSLIAEYSNWIEAVNSKEFKGELK